MVTVVRFVIGIFTHLMAGLIVTGHFFRQSLVLFEWTFGDTK